MIVLSHRGYWKNATEKNTRVAFERSFVMGFGTETDVRDHDGQLVISHDMASSSAMPIDEFFTIYQASGKQLPLALNIKADGLQQELRRQLDIYGIHNYFVFDMAVPDGLLYARQGFKTYTRHSEFEPVPAYYDLANGVWLDEFTDHWLTDTTIEAHLARGKSLCIVSPDLHKRANEEAWKHYRQLEKKIGLNRLMLCTDYPEQALEYFNA
jgi:glycerophosphoryl diester phosphodiesterase